MKPAAGGEIHWELSLDLEGMGSLGGLEYLTQLQLSADFAAGAEPDLAPLSGLTALTTLRLHLPYGISVSETAGGADAAAGPVLHGRRPEQRPLPPGEPDRSAVPPDIQ